MQSFMQTEAWADFKVRFGWTKHRVADVWVLERPILFGKSLLYAPEVWLPEQFDAAKTIIEQLSQFTGERPEAMALRLEVLNRHDHSPLGLAEFGFVPSFEEVQPRWRQVIPIEDDAEGLLKQMTEKGRYNVKLAARRGVEVKVRDEQMFLEEDTHLFYKLYLATATRQHFSPRPEGYIRELLKLLYQQKWGALIVAERDGQPLCAHIVSWYDGLASYLYGASIPDDQGSMAPYLVHFQSMLEAKEHGCREYDLLAIGPPDGLSPLSKKYAGLTQFKQRFGGRAVAIVGAYDFIMQPFWYKLYRTLEKSRRRL